MGEVFLFRKLVFLFCTPLITTNDVSGGEAFPETEEEHPTPSAAEGCSMRRLTASVWTSLGMASMNCRGFAGGVQRSEPCRSCSSLPQSCVHP